MASPVIITMLTFSRSTMPPHLVGVELGHQTDAVADEALAHDPPLRGAVHERGDGKEGELAARRLALLDHLLRTVHAHAGQGVEAAARGRRRRCAGATPRPWACRWSRPCRGCRGRRPIVGAKSRSGEPAAMASSKSTASWRGSGSPLSSSMTIDVAQGGELGQQRRHPGRELALVDEGDEVGVGEQVAELVLDVAEVDVDPHGPQLEHGPRRLDPLGAVQRVDADVVPGADPLGGEVVGQAVGPLLHLGVGAGAGRRRPGTRGRGRRRRQPRTGRRG